MLETANLWSPSVDLLRLPQLHVLLVRPAAGHLRQLVLLLWMRRPRRHVVQRRRVLHLHLLLRHLPLVPALLRRPGRRRRRDLLRRGRRHPLLLPAQGWHLLPKLLRRRELQLPELPELPLQRLHVQRGLHQLQLLQRLRRQLRQCLPRVLPLPPNVLLLRLSRECKAMYKVLESTSRS